MGHVFEHVHFCIFDNYVDVTAAYVKALKEGESYHRVVKFLF